MKRRRIIFPAPRREHGLPWSVAGVMDVSLYGGFFKSAGPNSGSPAPEYEFDSPEAKALAGQFTKHFRGKDI